MTPTIITKVVSTFSIVCLLTFFNQPSFADTSAPAHPIPIKKENLPIDQYPTYPKVDYGNEPEASIIKRGEYLTKIGDCLACHTDSANKGKSFAGNLPLSTPFGTFYSPNITPDKITGIGKWSAEDFINAMRFGKRPDGANLFPVFPYPYYAKVTDDDIKAIWAYLQKIPPEEASVKKNDVHFPFNWRFAQYAWKGLFFHTGEYQYDPKQSAQWNRGAYLVQGLGHCGMCHTPTNFLGAPKNKYFLSGAFVNGFWAPDITRSGLERVSVADVVKVFQVHELPKKAGRVIGPMAEVTHNSLMYLTDDDLRAMAVYLKSVKVLQRLGITGVQLRRLPWLEAKKSIKVRAVLVMMMDKKAHRILGDSANWNERVKQGARKIYRHAIDGYNLMPIKGGCIKCSDNDVTAAVDYMIYNSLNTEQWKNYQNPKPTQEQAAASGKEIYEKYCSVCHADGKFGAPKLGDKQAWKPVLDKNNFDDLITYVMHGSAKKPPKGGCKYCNTADIISAVRYMVEESKVGGDYSLW